MGYNGAMNLIGRIDALCGVSDPPSYGKKDERFRVRTLHLRIKDKHAKYLDALACQVNMVWNYCNELSQKILEREYRFCSAYDLHPYLAGAGKAGLDLHSQTVQGVADEYVQKRKQAKKAKLRWRVSRGARKSLGWIPFKESAVAYKNGQLHLAGVPLCLWDSYGLANYDLGGGSVSQDARGRWYVNLTARQYAWPQAEAAGAASKQESVDGAEREAVGIDLGLKDLLACSDGEKIEAQRFYRGLEEKLGVAQRAHKKGRVKAIHAKIAHRRKDFCHKASTALVGKYSHIFVGDVCASGLAKTRMAKSVLDAGWSMLRTQLGYKSDSAGVAFRVVGESGSTRECSNCGKPTGPTGLAGLSIRAWTCPECGAAHDRDTNSASVIKQRGWRMLAAEAADRASSTKKEKSVAAEEKSCEAETNKIEGESVPAFGAGHGPLAAGILVL
jgi:transposase